MTKDEFCALKPGRYWITIGVCPFDLLPVEINDYPRGYSPSNKTVWGLSKYRNAWAYRTMGLSAERFYDDYLNPREFRVFDNHEEFIKFVSDTTSGSKVK